MSRVLSADLSTTYTTAQYELGSIYVQPAEHVDGASGVDTSVDFDLIAGQRTWVFVKAAEVVAAGQLCEWDFTEYTTDKAKAYNIEPCPTDAKTPHLLAGVADHAIAASSYGWIIKNGVCVIKATSAVTVGSGLDSDGATGGEGEVMNAAAIAGTIGYALEDLSETKSGYIQGYIGLP